ncbi:CidA/LrgA family protein [Mesoterricola sediminis]|uniref:CidA/LrgA family protein n=1 Tax=Mesoterricola sediminis TaxID=2927980 RepID=UPI00292D150F|nr:CidA/LrgA family protein [Mesoterricola sediminis]
MLRARGVQTGLLIGVWWACDRAARALHAPVPGAVLGLGLLLLLLGTGRLPIRALQHSTRWLIGEMLLFFIPPMVSLLDYPQFLGWLGVKLIVAIAAGTLAVMVATAATIEIGHRALRPRR